MVIPATGKKIDVDGVDIARFRDGKAVEHWAYYDELGMMRQLGVIPEDKSPPNFRPEPTNLLVTRPYGDRHTPWSTRCHWTKSRYCAKA